VTTIASHPLSIDELARDTGLGKDRLRVWERRYGFPDPARAANGERVYSTDQLERLRLICRLIDQGARPGRIVPLSADALARQAEPQPDSQAPIADPAIADAMAQLRAGDTQRFRAGLRERLAQQGPTGFIYQTAAPCCGSPAMLGPQGRSRSTWSTT